jgi:alginate production protein
LHAPVALAQPGASPATSPPAEADDDDEGLRQRLTEREDRRRPQEPWSVVVGGRPLTVGGEYEIAGGAFSQGLEIDPGDDSDTWLLEQALELEAFYSFGPWLSFFAQARVGMEMVNSDADFIVERGEMWLDSENIAGSGVNLEIGRLNFEDDRRWWWDEELEAVRVEYERKTFSASLAAAYELAPSRLDQDFIDPEHDDVLWLVGEASWDWRRDHYLELFALYEYDLSDEHRVGDLLDPDREDESDRRLGWLGGRALGVFDLGARGYFGYWLDTGFVGGEEDGVEYGSAPNGRSIAEEREHWNVWGWAVDAGCSWILPFRWEPRVFAGYAIGSGDSSPGPGVDRSFRQSGLQTNEAGFGGVQRFAHFGILLDPELSNLGIVTIGTGISLLRSTSLDLVLHHYQQPEPATTLRGIRFDEDLNGEDPEVGQEVDLVFAVEEWERFEAELGTAAFRADRAFGEQRDRWTFGAFLALRYVF